MLASAGKLELRKTEIRWRFVMNASLQRMSVNRPAPT